MYNYKKIVAVSCLPTIAVIIGLFLIYCTEDTPDRCGDGKPLNTYTQFCCSDQVVNKCGGDTFDCDSKFCYLELLYDKCGGKEYDPAKDFCDPVSQTVYPLCAGQDYNTATHGCVNDVLLPRCCKDGTPYDPSKQESCDTETCVITVPNDNAYVYFDGNGGDNPPAPILAKPGTSVTLPQQPGNMTRDGYDFNGWNTDKNAKGDNNLNPGFHYTVKTNNDTLFAMWKTIEYRIVYINPKEKSCIIIEAMV